MASPDPPPPGDLHARVSRGAGWASASQVVGQLIRSVGAIVVARMLAPEDYGLAMLALVFTSLVLVFSDLALGAALVQRPDLTEEDRSTAFWITVVCGVVFTAGGVGLSWPVADLYGQPQVQPLLAVLSASFALTALGATQQSLLLRDLQYRRMELVTLAGTLAGSAAAVVLAIAGTGAWAIIGQQLVTAASLSVLMWRASGWRPQRRCSRASAHYLWSFSGFLVGHRLLFYVHQNADNFLIGRFIGAPALGAYAVAYNVMLQPAARIATPVQRILSPAFARIQDDPKRIAEAWVRATRLVGAITIPALAGMVVLAPDFVPVVLGEQWHAAVPVVQILAWVGIIQALQAINVDILMARDRTSTLFRYMIGFCAAHLTAFSIGVHWGITGVATAYLVSSALVEPVLTVLTARALGASPWTFLRSVGGVAQAAGGMVAALFMGRNLLIDAGTGTAVRLVALVALGAAVYLPLLLWRVPDVAREVRSIMATWRPARLGTPAAAVET